MENTKKSTSSQVGRAHRLLEMVSEGSPRHGPIHLLSAGASEIGFRWDPVRMGWSRPGLPLLGNVARLQLIFAVGRASGVVRRWIFFGSLQMLNSSHVRERVRLC